MKLPMRRTLEEVIHTCGVNPEIILHYVEEDWIHPADKEHGLFDDEDVARIELICELKEEFNVNEEAIPIILHLLDQINLLHRRLKYTL